VSLNVSNSYIVTIILESTYDYEDHAQCLHYLVGLQL
jgi:hypothetical protein